MLVNDEPVTAYQIDQRANFLGLNSGAGPELKAKAEARWAEIIKDPKTNERFQAVLREKNVKSTRGGAGRAEAVRHGPAAVHARAAQA